MSQSSQVSFLHGGPLQAASPSREPASSHWDTFRRSLYWLTGPSPKRVELAEYLPPLNLQDNTTSHCWRQSSTSWEARLSYPADGEKKAWKGPQRTAARERCPDEGRQKCDTLLGPCLILKSILISSLSSLGLEFKNTFQGQGIDDLTYLEHEDGRSGSPT